MSEWNNENLVQDYAEKAANPEHNWYEYRVNIPSLFEMLPDDGGVVLDYGCGSGDVTTMLTERFSTVEGSDYSEAMINKARADYPDIPFFVWDGLTELPDRQQRYSLVFSKLAIHFVDDIEALAKNLHSMLDENGRLVFSVPHPVRTVQKADGSYWDKVPYPTEIGSYGIQVTMIHRSIEDYISAFTANGFLLSELKEPEIPEDIAKEFDQTEDDTALPKRLNLTFVKSNT